MPTKKKRPTANPDRHLDSFLVRLPGWLRPEIERLAAADRRTMSNMAAILLEDAIAAKDQKAKPQEA
jgi:hypothetical protein